jgi:hypothetical protein
MSFELKEDPYLPSRLPSLCHQVESLLCRGSLIVVVEPGISVAEQLTYGFIPPSDLEQGDSAIQL